MVRFSNILIGILLVSVIAACTSPGPRIIRSKPTPVDLDNIPNPVPRYEAPSRYGNPASYEVFGRRYYTRSSNHGFSEQGIASWYGPNFHGKRTSSGEPYDMYKMTAAHKSIKLPAYVEVTNLTNGRRIIVRVNDRGPFHENRVIDLSYVAAAKLDLVRHGTGLVEIRVIDPANPQAHRTLPAPPKLTTRQQTTRKVAAPVSQATSVTPKEAIKPSREPQTGKQDYVGQQDFEPLQIDPVASDKQMFVQLGAFSDQQNALRLKQRVQGLLNRNIAVINDAKSGRALYKVRIGPVLDVDVADNIVHRLNSAGLYDHHVVFQ